jgi:ribosome-associated heat shock protein Hsp15
VGLLSQDPRGHGWILYAWIAWLAAARLFKSRTQATAACDGGHIIVNGAKAKASHLVRIGDEVRRDSPRGKVIVDVLSLAERRLSPLLARELYRDRSPPAPPKDESSLFRADFGRPDARDRRALRRLRGK